MFGFSLDTLLVVLPVGLMSITIHEVAHGYAAFRLGDPTAKSQGRLTLNPLAHIDPIGLLAILIIKFGWAKPVPVNPGYFRRPGRDMMWVALAGPISNVAFAVAFAVMWKVIAAVAPSLANPGNWGREPLDLFFYFGIYINVILAAFNIIPVPPLDGSRVLAYFLPPHMAERYRDLDRYGMFLVAGVIFLLPWLTGINIVSIVAGGALKLFTAIMF